MDKLEHTLEKLAIKLEVVRELTEELLAEWEQHAVGCKYWYDGELDCSHEGNSDPVCTSEDCPLIKNKEEAGYGRIGLIGGEL